MSQMLKSPKSTGGFFLIQHKTTQKITFFTEVNKQPN